MESSAPAVLRSSDILAWDGDRLLVTSATVNGEARRPRLSPSVAKAVSSCAARYAGERVLSLGVEFEDPFAPAPVGTVAHTVLERLMSLARTKRTPLAARRIMYELMLELTSPNPDKRWPGLPAGRQPEWLTAVDSAFMGLFDIVDPRTVVVHKTEMRLDDVFIGEVPFKGFIDLVARVDDGGCEGPDPEHGRWLEIIDFKTARRMPYTPPGGVNEHHDQIRMYRIGLAQKLGTDLPFRGSVFYTRDKVARAVRVPMRGPDLDATTRRFASAWRRMHHYADQASWPAKASPLCGWCPLVATCPAAAREWKAPRVEGLPTAVDLPIPVRRPLPAVIPLRELNGGCGRAAHEQVRHTGDPGADLDYDALMADLVDLELDQPATGSRTRTDTGRPGDRGPASTTREQAMGRAQVLYEDKPFEETAGPNAGLNPNSYAAVGAFGLVSMAVEELAKAQLPLTPGRVRGLSRLFASIVAEVQRDFTGVTGYQQGMNTRIRGALRTTVESMPLPLTGSGDDLRDWHEAARRRVAAIARFSVELWDQGEPVFDGDYTAILGP